MKYSLLLLALTLPFAAQAALDTNRIEQITGLKGTYIRRSDFAGSC